MSALGLLIAGVAFLVHLDDKVGTISDNTKEMSSALKSQQKDIQTIKVDIAKLQVSVADVRADVAEIKTVLLAQPSSTSPSSGGASNSSSGGGTPPGSGTLVVGLVPDAGGLSSFTSSSSTWTGVDVDLARQLATKLNFRSITFSALDTKVAPQVPKVGSYIAIVSAGDLMRLQRKGWAVIPVNSFVERYGSSVQLHGIAVPPKLATKPLFSNLYTALGSVRPTLWRRLESTLAK